MGRGINQSRMKIHVKRFQKMISLNPLLGHIVEIVIFINYYLIYMVSSSVHFNMDELRFGLVQFGKKLNYCLDLFFSFQK
jgi:hypothetical protein